MTAGVATVRIMPHTGKTTGITDHRIAAGAAATGAPVLPDLRRVAVVTVEVGEATAAGMEGEEEEEGTRWTMIPRTRTFAQWLLITPTSEG